jgi:hypothetical protein
MIKKVTQLAVAILFLTTLSVSAQTGTWTAVGSTGVVDTTSPASGVINGTGLGFLPSGGSNAGTIVARYNVTNTWGGGADDTPAWTRFEVGAINTDTFSTVTGRLYEVDPCSGARTLVCQVTNDSGGSFGACESCTFTSNTFDFSQDLYYAEVSITRSVGTGNPVLTTLRIQ